MIDPLVDGLKALFADVLKASLKAVDDATTVHEMEQKLEALFAEDQQVTKARKLAGTGYAKRMQSILRENRQNVSETVLEADRKRLVKKVKGGEKIMPEVKHMLGRSKVFLKAADSGKEMSRTQREALRRIVKRVLLEEPYQTRAGNVKKHVAVKVKAALKEHYEGYTKQVPPFGIPENLKAIAVTETRSLLSNLRQEYMTTTQETLEATHTVEKEWEHNSSLSHVSRKSHRAMDGTRVPVKAKFVLAGKYNIDGPHDYSLPASEVVSCNCGMKYYVMAK